MNKKNVYIVVALLVAVLALGVGYALTAGPLNIGGTATAKESATSFNVKFTNATPDTPISDEASSTATITADDTATMTVTLTNVGNQQTATFEVTNSSQAGLKAVINPANVHIYEKGTTTTFNSEYFDVTTNIGSNIEIASGSSATFTVTVAMKKAVIGSDVTEQFDIVLENIDAVAE